MTLGVGEGTQWTYYISRASNTGWIVHIMVSEKK